MNGVFHGVITPTGPIGTRVEMFQCSSLGVLRPSRASAHLSAKKRKFSAARIAALAMKRCAWPVSMHSSTAISSARSSMASATRCSSFLRIAAGMSRQDLKASAAAVAARSMSSALPRATVASTAPSTGDLVSNVWPEIDGTILPSIMWPMPSALQFGEQGRGAVAIGLKHVLRRDLIHGAASTFSASWMLLRFQLVSLSLICMSNDSANLLFANTGSRWADSALKICSPAFLRVGEVAAFAEPQHHVEKAEIRLAVGDRVMLASDGADADAAEREDAGFDRGLADQFDDLAHVDAGVEIGGIFDREMRHVLDYSNDS